MVPPLEPPRLYHLLRRLRSKVLESKHLRLPVTCLPILEFNQLELPTDLVLDLLMRYRTTPFIRSSTSMIPPGLLICISTLLFQTGHYGAAVSDYSANDKDLVFG